MTQEDFENHLKPAYEVYLKEHKSEPFVLLDECDLTYQEFLNKIRSRYSFAHMWGVDFKVELLSDEERYKIWYGNNFETGFEYNPKILPNFDDEYWEPTPVKKFVLTYNNKTFEFYEPLK